MTAHISTVPTVGQSFDILDGQASYGNPLNERGFLIWDPNGGLNTSTLEEEITHPELSLSWYTNANDHDDHELSEGDYVKSLPGNNGGVANLLENLVGQDIIIPVWDSFDQGAIAYHINGFIQVRLIHFGVNLTGSNPSIMATYLGPVDLADCPVLSISKVGPPLVTAGDPITYTLMVTNSGLVAATNLLITDTLPVGANYVAGGSLVGEVISWTVPSLAGSQSLTRTFTVTAGQTITKSLYRASPYLYPAGTEPYSATGQLSVVTLVEPPVVVIPSPVLTITKRGPVTASAASLITYTLTVTNTGDLTATNLVITDALPAGASYVSGGSLVGGVVSWTVPSLAISQSLSRTLTVTAGGTITNSRYRVSAGDLISATGQVNVVTTIIKKELYLRYLPIIVKGNGEP